VHRRPGLLLAALIGVSIGASLIWPATTVEARKVIVKSKPMPKPGPPPAPIGGVGGGVPDQVPDRPDNGDSPPVVAATATIWAQAGSRSWTGCAKLATEAGKQLFGYGEDTNSFPAAHHWAIQADECPNAPEVLAMAARAELLRRFDLPEALDGKTKLDELERELDESRARALAWTDEAKAELRRRRDPRALGLDYWQARALLSANAVDEATEALRRGLREGSVEGWKLRRLLALAELFSGDLDAAVAHATRASVDAPQNDRLASAYVRALVLDRAGDSAGAARVMKYALDGDGDRSQMRTLEVALPMHERLYLRAYAQTVRRDPSAALRLWDAYLARPEPEPPERRLAERHRSALEPLPANLGGMARPDEGAFVNESQARP
jgi:hypothetical protein